MRASGCSTVCWPRLNNCSQGKALVSSICPFHWCKYSHHGRLQVTSTTFLKAELGRNTQVALLNRLRHTTGRAGNLGHPGVLGTWHSHLIFHIYNKRHSLFIDILHVRWEKVICTRLWLPPKEHASQRGYVWIAAEATKSCGRLSGQGGEMRLLVLREELGGKNRDA